MSPAATLTPTVLESNQQSKSPAPVTTGLTDVAPLLAGLVPFALAIGGSAATIGFSLVETVATAFLVLAGSAQLVAIGLMGSGAGALVTMATAITLNVRFSLYGAAVGRWFGSLPRWQRLLLVVPIVDQSFLLCEQRFKVEKDVRWRMHYYLTLSAALVTMFVACQIVGFLLGASLPPSLGLHMASPLVFGGMLARSLDSRPHRRAMIVAAMVVVLAAGLPAGLPLPLAIVAGLFAGAQASRSSHTNQSPNQTGSQAGGQDKE